MSCQGWPPEIPVGVPILRDGGPLASICFSSGGPTPGALRPRRVVGYGAGLGEGAAAASSEFRGPLIRVMCCRDPLWVIRVVLTVLRSLPVFPD
jgi:hypothetical protein